MDEIQSNTGAAGQPSMQNQINEEELSDIIGVKDEILEVLNQLKGMSGDLQKGFEVPHEKVQTVIARGENLANRIGALPGMEQAGKEFLVHIHKIEQAINDLRNFDALKKENLIAGVKF
jgi:hypothetical protein